MRMPQDFMVSSTSQPFQDWVRMNFGAELLGITHEEFKAKIYYLWMAWAAGYLARPAPTIPPTIEYQPAVEPMYRIECDACAFKLHRRDMDSAVRNAAQHMRERRGHNTFVSGVRAVRLQVES